MCTNNNQAKFFYGNKFFIGLDSLDLKNWIFEASTFPRISSPNSRIVKLNSNSICFSTCLNFTEQKSKVRISGVGEIKYVKSMVQSVIKHQKDTSIEPNFILNTFDLNNKNFDVFLNLNNKNEISVSEDNNTYSILEFETGNPHKGFEIIQSRVKLKCLDVMLNIKGQKSSF